MSIGENLSTAVYNHALSLNLAIVQKVSVGKIVAKKAPERSSSNGSGGDA